MIYGGVGEKQGHLELNKEEGSVFYGKNGEYMWYGCITRGVRGCVRGVLDWIWWCGDGATVSERL